MMPFWEPCDAFWEPCGVQKSTEEFGHISISEAHFWLEARTCESWCISSAVVSFPINLLSEENAIYNLACISGQQAYAMLGNQTSHVNEIRLHAQKSWYSLQIW